MNVAEICKRHLRLILAATLGIASACAQTQQTIQTTADVNFSGTVTQLAVASGNAPLVLLGTGTLGTLGAAGVYIDVEQSSNGTSGAVNIRFFNIGKGGQQENASLPYLFANTANAKRTVPKPGGFTETATGTADIASGSQVFLGATGSFPFSMAITAGAINAPITFTLTGTATINLDTSVQPPAQVLTSTTGSPVRFNEALLLGPQIKEYFYTVETNDGGSWLTIVSPNPDPTPPLTPGTATGEVNPSGMSPGVYQGSVQVTTTSGGGSSQLRSPHVDQTATGPTATVPVTMIVPAAAQLVVSQTGVSFQTIAGTPSHAAQSVSVSSSGAALAFSATVSTLGGGGWLTVSPANGSASATAPVSVTVGANPTGLAPGTYSGRVDFASAAASNSPQSVYVTLTVLSSTASTGPVIAPSSLIFVAAEGSNPAPQMLTISSASAQSIDISSLADAANPWFSISPSSGAITAAQPLTQSISVSTTGLAPGVYQGHLSEQVSAATAYLVPVVLVVTPAGGACTPTRLVTVLTNLMDKFQVIAGSPTPLQAAVLDDCGVPLTAGSVMAMFNTGDAPVAMVPTGAGDWAGTWMPHNTPSGTATVTVSAHSTASVASSSAVAAGGVTENKSVPMMAPVSPVVSAASFTSGQPLAPGTFVAIFGPNVGPGSGELASVPFPKVLAGVQVLLGGEPIPLQYVGANQINAVIPWDVPLNATLPLAVQFNGMSSMPVGVVTAPATPAVFTQNQSGSGLGSILISKADGTVAVAGPSASARTGDVLEVYCAGLGAVNSPPAAGEAASLTSLSHTVLPVTATVGGVAAEVPFSGLAPGFVGLYQVNVTVPAGVSPGPAVAVVLKEGSFSSPPVTVPIQ
ncbi:MAG TPA: hypothetical protein VMH80_14810 [Bryobacteraceae bacterium]|nr:hypothetical protein [Bryobacteraceae bacterium]